MAKLDLLLVNAPSRIAVYGKHLANNLAAIEPPVWAGLIARHCLNQGYSVQILDAEAEEMTVEQTATEIEFRQPRLAVFCIYGQQPSASTQCMPAASAVAKALLSFPHKIPTLALGTHPSALSEQTIREEPFDFVCQGEGPKTIVPMLKDLRLGSPAHHCTPFSNDFQWPPGLWGKAGSNAISKSSFGVPANFTNLDVNLPSQAWHLLDMKKYRAHNWHLWTGDPSGGYASVQTSLSCPFRCAFCSIAAPFGGSGQGYRCWSVQNVVDQIESLVKDYGISNIKIPDEMFCLNPARVKEICTLLYDRRLGDVLNMWAYARVDTVKDLEMLALMRLAGFRWLGLGIESGSEHVRNGIEKGSFAEEQIITAVARVHYAGIAVGANYIFGLPDDTLESMQTTLDLACHLNTEWANFYCAMAYPGSALHKVAKEKGWQLPEDPGGPGWIGYSQHNYETLPLATETLSAAEVLVFRDEAFMHYFGRPEYLHMIRDKFGDEAGKDVLRMLSFGKPKRKLLERI